MLRSKRAVSDQRNLVQLIDLFHTPTHTHTDHVTSITPRHQLNPPNKHPFSVLIIYTSRAALTVLYTLKYTFHCLD